MMTGQASSLHMLVTVFIRRDGQPDIGLEFVVDMGLRNDYTDQSPIGKPLIGYTPLIEGLSMNISYAAVERFGPDNGETWTNYIAFSGLYHLKELVSLDGLLCPNLLTDYTEEDWQHISDEEFAGYFRDLDYLLARLTTASEYQVLAVIKNPLGAETLDDPRFEFIGYDLIEHHGTISALTNCGGFDNAFQPDDLSVYGLVSD